MNFPKYIKFGLPPIISLVLIAMSTAAASDPESQVRNGRLSNCQKKTVGQLFDNFVGSPKWSSIKKGNTHSLVTVGGDILYFNKPSKIALNFLVDNSAGRFNFEGIEINDQRESPFVASGMILKLCNK